MINTQVSNYYSYLTYYYKDFSKFFTVKDLKSIEKELNVIKKTLNNLLDKNTLRIIDRMDQIKI